MFDILFFRWQWPLYKQSMFAVMRWRIRRAVCVYDILFTLYNWKYNQTFYHCWPSIESDLLWSWLFQFSLSLLDGRGVPAYYKCFRFSGSMSCSFYSEDSLCGSVYFAPDDKKAVPLKTLQDDVNPYLESIKVMVISITCRQTTPIYE